MCNQKGSTGLISAIFSRILNELNPLILDEAGQKDVLYSPQSETVSSSSDLRANHDTNPINRDSMNIIEIDRKIAELQSQKKQELKNQRAQDLKLVKDLCKRHGFTSRMLKDSVGRGRDRKPK